MKHNFKSNKYGRMKFGEKSTQKRIKEFELICQTCDPGYEIMISKPI